MRSLRRFFTRVVNSVTGRVHDERLREEIEAHIALLGLLARGFRRNARCRLIL
jgi:predicted metal-dependent hydrolase